MTCQFGLYYLHCMMHNPSMYFIFTSREATWSWESVGKKLSLLLFVSWLFYYLSCLELFSSKIMMIFKRKTKHLTAMFLFASYLLDKK